MRVEGATAREHFPIFESAYGNPESHDVYTWETVELTEVPVSGPEELQHFDNCCYPPSGRRWHAQ